MEALLSETGTMLAQASPAAGHRVDSTFVGGLLDGPRPDPQNCESASLPVLAETEYKPGRIRLRIHEPKAPAK